jgi:hypothetical protein
VSPVADTVTGLFRTLEEKPTEQVCIGPSTVAAWRLLTIDVRRISHGYKEVVPVRPAEASERYVLLLQ